TTYSGGLVGYHNGGSTHSYWNVETSGQSASHTGTGKTTIELQDATTFSTWSPIDWDIANITKGQYPKLLDNNYLRTLESNTESFQYHYGFNRTHSIEIYRGDFELTAIASSSDASIEVFVEST